MPKKKQKRAVKTVGKKQNFRKRYASDGRGMEPNKASRTMPGPWENFSPDESTTKAVLKRYERWRAKT